MSVTDASGHEWIQSLQERDREEEALASEEASDRNVFRSLGGSFGDVSPQNKRGDCVIDPALRPHRQRAYGENEDGATGDDES